MWRRRFVSVGQLAIWTTCVKCWASASACARASSQPLDTFFLFMLLWILLKDNRSSCIEAKQRHTNKCGAAQNNQRTNIGPAATQSGGYLMPRAASGPISAQYCCCCCCCRFCCCCYSSSGRFPSLAFACVCVSAARARLAGLSMNHTSSPSPNSARPTRTRAHSHGLSFNVLADFHVQCALSLALS